MSSCFDYTPDRWDHERDERKVDRTPAHRFDKPRTTALEIAVLCQAISITAAADLIEQFGNTRAAEGRLEGVGQLDRRLSVAMESPLTPANYGGGDAQS